MNLADLRSALTPLVVGFKQSRHVELADICRKLGMAEPPEQGELTKEERLRASLAATPDSDLPTVCERYIASFEPKPLVRNQLQDILLADDPGPAVPRNQRHDVARSLDPHDLYSDAREFDQLIEGLFILEDDVQLMTRLLSGRDESLREEIAQHVHRNPGDWSGYDLCERLGAFDCSDRRFRLLIEGLLSPRVRPDEESQRGLVSRLNGHLQVCGAELREMTTDGGYPVFRIISLRRGVAGRPKNIIFASRTKPDLRFKDAINNDVEIMSDPNLVLVYDEPIERGVTWGELQAWWAKTRQIADPETAKRTLYRQLEQSLPESSPPQALLFRAFFETFRGSVARLPALLPEVHFHWDPKTVRERGPDALQRQRLDFLLLLQNGDRIVVEVDGKHHYSDSEGRASPQAYGAMMAADRELRLAGYELYRFGGLELNDRDGQRVAAHFFRRLFKRHGITGDL